MTTATLSKAIAQVQNLPNTDQDRIGRDLARYVEHLQSLRGQINEGIQSLDAGLGKELNIEKVIARAKRQYAKG